MNKECPSSNLQMIPIDKIEVLNSRDRNGKVFADIVGNIKNIGLKKPITVTPRTDADGHEKFLLICGEGRLNRGRTGTVHHEGIRRHPDGRCGDMCRSLERHTLSVF